MWNTTMQYGPFQKPFKTTFYHKPINSKLYPKHGQIFCFSHSSFLFQYNSHNLRKLGKHRLYFNGTD